MSDSKPLKITKEMLPGFRRHTKFPKFAIGSFEKDVFVAHLHEPILLAKVDFQDRTMLLRLSRDFPFDPMAREYIDLTDAMAQFIREESLAGEDVEHDIAPEIEPAPEIVVLSHGGWIVENEEDRWLGMIRTRNPRFILEINGESVLPLDPCDDIAPYLQQAKQFFNEWPLPPAI